MKNLLKRITAVMLVAVLCVCCFAACGGEDAETKATKAPTQKPTASVKPTESAKPTEKPTEQPSDEPTVAPTEKPSSSENDLTDGDDVTIEANVTEDPTYGAEFAIDNDESTRWSGAGDAVNSDGSDSDYKEIMIDLGAEYEIGKFYIVWEQMNNPYKISYATDKDGEWSNLMTRGIPEDLFEEFLVPKTKARFIKISTQDGGYCLCSIYEIEIIEFAEGMEYVEDVVDEDENVALNKTVTTNHPIEKAFKPELATDGDITTRWAPMPGTSEDTITVTVDLGQVYNLSEIQILFESCESDFVIEVCDTEDGEYKVIEECMAVTTTAEPCVIDAEGHSGRYIRYSRQGGVWGSIYELEVYAKAA